MKHYKTLYLTLLIISLYALSGCTSIERENEEAEKFLAFYIKSVLKKDTINLLEDSHDKSANDCLIKSIDSIKKIIPLNKQDTQFKWANIPNAKILKETDLPNRYTISWSDFIKKHHTGFYQISKPIFSKDFNYVILLQGYTCYERCGTGWIEIYEKTAKGWKQIEKRLCWLS